MEALIVTLAVLTAVASLGVAIIVLLQVARRHTDAHRRIVSTAGFRWLLLGLAAMAVFFLLDVSPLLPALVTAGGLIAIIIELHRNGIT
jgi:hypothetical protein